MELMEIEQVLSNLNSALSILNNKIVKLDEATKAVELKDKKYGDIDIAQKNRSAELDKREISVQHIKSIVDATEKAKSLIKEAKDATDVLSTSQEDFKVIQQKFAQDKAQQMRENDADKKANKDQAEALKKERKELDERIRQHKITVAIDKDK